MIRLQGIKLKLDHSSDDLKNAILSVLGIDVAELVSYQVFKRSYDARRHVMSLVYIIDVKVNNENSILTKHKAK